MRELLRLQSRSGSAAYSGHTQFKTRCCHAAKETQTDTISAERLLEDLELGLDFVKREQLRLEEQKERLNNWADKLDAYQRAHMPELAEAASEGSEQEIGLEQETGEEQGAEEEQETEDQETESLSRIEENLEHQVPMPATSLQKVKDQALVFPS